jgi:hypothetical protein
LGFIDADLNLKNLLPDIITATNDVIDLVGYEVYKTVEAYVMEQLPMKTKISFMPFVTQ